MFELNEIKKRNDRKKLIIIIIIVVWIILNKKNDTKLQKKNIKLMLFIKILSK